MINRGFLSNRWVLPGLDSCPQDTQEAGALPEQTIPHMSTPTYAHTTPIYTPHPLSPRTHAFTASHISLTPQARAHTHTHTHTHTPHIALPHVSMCPPPHLAHPSQPHTHHSPMYTTHTPMEKGPYHPHPSTQIHIAHNSCLQATEIQLKGASGSEITYLLAQLGGSGVHLTFGLAG